MHDNAELTLKARYQIEYPEGFAIEIFDTASDPIIRFDGDEALLSVWRKSPGRQTVVNLRLADLFRHTDVSGGEGEVCRPCAKAYRAQR